MFRIHAVNFSLSSYLSRFFLRPFSTFSSPSPQELSTILEVYSEAFENFWKETLRPKRNDGKDDDPSHQDFARSTWEYLLPPLLRLCVGGGVGSGKLHPADVAWRVAKLVVDSTFLADSMPPTGPIGFRGDDDAPVGVGAQHQLHIKSSADLIQFFTGDKRIGIGLVTAYLARLLDAASGPAASSSSSSSVIRSSFDSASLQWTLLSTWFRFRVCGGTGAATSTTPLAADARHLAQQLFRHHPLVARICKHLNPDFISLQVRAGAELLRRGVTGKRL